MVYSFIYPSESTDKEPSQKNGEHIRSPSTELHADGRPTYNGVQPGSLKGNIYDTAITTPLPCSLQHDTFHLGLEDTKPR